MKLKELQISIVPSWQDENAGKYTGKIEYEGERGTVSMVLSPEISNAVLLCIGETVTKFAADAAREVEKSIIASVAEAKKPMLEAATVEEGK